MSPTLVCSSPARFPARSPASTSQSMAAGLPCDDIAASGVLPMITVADVEAARARLGNHIRHTPLIEVDNLSTPVSDASLFLKLECLQATGSFKARGATNRLLATPREELARGIVAA